MAQPSIKPIAMRHLPVLTAMHNEVFKQGNPLPVDLARNFAGVYHRANLGGCWAAFDGGRPVAHAASRLVDLELQGIRLRWAAYGNVMTLEEWRGRGLASRLNAGLWGRLRHLGADGVFISGDRGLYTRAGAAPCGDFRKFSLGPAALAGLAGSGLSLRRAGPADAALLAGLGATEAVSFRYAASDFANVLQHGCAHLLPGRAFLVQAGGRPLAWAVLQMGFARPYDPRTTRGSLLDWAGSRSALLAALPAMARAMGLRSLDLQVPAQDRGLLAALEKMGLQGGYSGVDGTQLLLDPLRLWARLRPWFRSHLGRAAGGGLGLQAFRGGYRLRFGGQELSLPGRAALARLMLGAEPQAWERSLPKGELGQALRRVFPLPLPGMGLGWM